jgi:hypothetical protein
MRKNIAFFKPRNILIRIAPFPRRLGIGRAVLGALEITDCDLKLQSPVHGALPDVSDRPVSTLSGSSRPSAIEQFRSTRPPITRSRRSGGRARHSRTQRGVNP